MRHSRRNDSNCTLHLQLYRSGSKPFTIKGQNVLPKDHVKILGMVMDAKPKYKEHIARAASKVLEAAMELRRIRGLSPSTARQLFASTAAPVVDYASNVQMHVSMDKLVGSINRVQRIGAQVIVGMVITSIDSLSKTPSESLD